jgi:hypothetical protein
MTLSQTMPKALEAMKNNKKLVLLTVILELLFLIAITKIHYEFFIPTADAATQMGERLQGIQDTQDIEQQLKQDQEFIQAYRTLKLLMIYFVLAILTTWLIFRTTIWHITYKMILPKMPILTSLKYTLLTLMWMIPLTLTFIAYALGNTIIALILGLLTYYYAQISYALVPAQNTLRKTFKTNAITTIIVNTLLLIIATIPLNWLQTNPLITLTSYALITAPLILYTRLNIITSIWQKRAK